jgi:ribosomal protein S12 methylthiotransferase
MELAAEISAQRLAAKVGRTMDVLVDQVVDSGTVQPVIVARSASDAPEIDGTVRILGSAQALRKIAVGSMVHVKITASGPYDLEARLAS